MNRRTPDEVGAATMLAGGMMLLLTLVLAAGLVVVQVVAAHRVAQNAADLAALAGAGRVQEGLAACPAASLVAARNGAVLSSCTERSEEVLVGVQVRARSILGIRPTMSARARAGPVGASPTE